VLFSITHELCYTNVLYMLDLAGIPLHSAAARRGHPLVIAGGGCTFNAEPLAPFVDVMVMGDGEEILPEMLSLMARGKDEGWDAKRVDPNWPKPPGVYVPSFVRGRRQRGHGSGGGRAGRRSRSASCWT
jgi:radical SAM superfamily enzyme YgiQ (UPF0313 family)